MKNSISRLASFQPLKKNYWNNAPAATPRRRYNDKLLSSEFVFDHQPLFISSLDVKGVWTTLARGDCEFLRKIQSKDFVQWINENVPVAERVGVLKAVSDCRATQLSTLVEFRIQSQDQNAPQWLELRCSPVPTQSMIQTALLDISERKLMEKEIRDASELAERANVAKTRFLANMSHELRTPLNAIIGFSDILKSGMVPPENVEKQTEYHTLINDSAHHLLQVLNDVLDMSKIEAGKYVIFPEEIDATQIISSVCQMLMPLAQKDNITFDHSTSDEPVMLDADSRALRQILINLISNAIKFSEPGTAVKISAQRVGRKVELLVADQGRGISASKLAGLGQPFHQVDSEANRQHEGTGLGLSIVKGLIELHKGDFDIESTPGRGTNVRVKLPQSLHNSTPVPADDCDTIIKIAPRPSTEDLGYKSISRLVG